MEAEPVVVRVRRLAHGAGLPLPERASPGSSGLDLRAAIEAEQVLDPGARALIPTALVLELPAGWEGQVRPRSGLAARHGVSLLNTPGTVDSDFRGEIKVLLVNLGAEPFTLRRGDRIAQLVIAPVARVVLEAADRLSTTARGEGGFGSSGID